MMRPNIFNIATKELSQDAFITWLLLWADQKNKKEDIFLHDCGQYFVGELLSFRDKDHKIEIKEVVAYRQVSNIDIWVQINNQYLIIIEDKTFSKEHGNQLGIYKEYATQWCQENHFENPICVYLKTGNESRQSLNQIENRGYSIFNRTGFIAVLEMFRAKITNNIFIDFYERLIKLETINNSWEIELIGDWHKKNCWEGFYQFLEKNDLVVNWFFVNNPSRGFMAAILKWKFWGKIPCYIQIEEYNVCIKIATSDEEGAELPADKSREWVRNTLSRQFILKSKEHGLDIFRKPNRFGSGNYMTIVVVDHDKWLGPKDTRVDKKKVIGSLSEIIECYEKIIQQIPTTNNGD